MSAISGRASCSVTVSIFSSGVLIARAKITRRSPQPASLKTSSARRKAVRPARRARIVHRNREIGFRGEPQALLDHRPRLQIVGEIDRAEIMAERRAGARGGGQHRGDAGQHADGKLVPLRRLFQRLEHGGRHREHAGVAGGDDDDLRAFGREPQRLARALQLLAIVGGMQRRPSRGGTRAT